MVSCRDNFPYGKAVSAIEDLDLMSQRAEQHLLETDLDNGKDNRDERGKAQL